MIKETVSAKVRDERISRKHHADVLYFGYYGRYIPSRTVFQLSSVDDKFYLVILDGRKKTIELAYPCKMYEYKESERSDQI